MPVKPGDMYGVPILDSKGRIIGFDTGIVVVVDQGDIRRGLTPARPVTVHLLVPGPKIVQKDFMWLRQWCRKVE